MGKEQFESGKCIAGGLYPVLGFRMLCDEDNKALHVTRYFDANCQHQAQADLSLTAGVCSTNMSYAGSKYSCIDNGQTTVESEPLLEATTGTSASHTTQLNETAFSDDCPCLSINQRCDPSNNLCCSEASGTKLICSPYIGTDYPICYSGLKSKSVDDDHRRARLAEQKASNNDCQCLSTRGAILATTCVAMKPVGLSWSVVLISATIILYATQA